MPTVTRSSIYIDANGMTRQCILNGGVFGLGGVELALIAASNMDVLRSWEGPLTVNGAPAPTVASYQAIADYAALLYQDAVGDQVTVTLPSPKAAIFLADGVTVNPAAVAAVNAAVIGTVQTAAGGTVTLFIGGVRKRANRDYL
jgi:hypothetical protein